MNGRIDVKVFFDAQGNRACAKDFASGEFCAYYRTQRWGTLETCVFAPNDGKRATAIERRDPDGLGSLIPPDWCPIVVEPHASDKPGVAT